MKPRNLDHAIASITNKLSTLSCLQMSPDEYGITQAFKLNRTLWVTYLAGALLESDLSVIIVVAKYQDSSVPFIEVTVDERPVVISPAGIYDNVDEALLINGETATKYFHYQPEDFR